MRVLLEQLSVQFDSYPWGGWGDLAVLSDGDKGPRMVVSEQTRGLQRAVNPDPSTRFAAQEASKVRMRCRPVTYVGKAAASRGATDRRGGVEPHRPAAAVTPQCCVHRLCTPPPPPHLPPLGFVTVPFWAPSCYAARRLIGGARCRTRSCRLPPSLNSERTSRSMLTDGSPASIFATRDWLDPSTRPACA